MIGTVPPRLSFFANLNAASKVWRMILVAKTPTSADEQPKACSMTAAPPPPGPARTCRSSGTLKSVNWDLGPEHALWPMSSGSSSTLYAPSAFWETTSRVTSRTMMLSLGSLFGSCSVPSPSTTLATTHWRSAPLLSQPPLLVVHSWSFSQHLRLHCRRVSSKNSPSSH